MRLMEQVGEKPPTTMKIFRETKCPLTQKACRQSLIQKSIWEPPQ